MKNEQLKPDEELMLFVSLVPKHLCKFIKHGIFLIPTHLLIDDYSDKKVTYLQEISNTKQPSVNSLHKYTSPCPLSHEDIAKLNLTIQGPLDNYYTHYLKQYTFKNKQPEPILTFGITYDSGHQELQLHFDDSTYTVNLCLRNSAEGNEVVFNEMVRVDPL